MQTHRVFKYQADENGTYHIPDRDPIVVHVAQQNGSVFPVLWCKVNVYEQRGVRTYQCVGTGQAVEASTLFVGSAVCDDFVWHVIDNGVGG